MTTVAIAEDQLLMLSFLADVINGFEGFRVVAQAGDGERTFTAEVPLSNVDASLRSGMTGRAKIFIGWRPAGYVLLRRPALWMWQTLWYWIGW